MDRLTVTQLEEMEKMALAGSGCRCPSCKYTNSFMDKGFAAWPTGKPAGKSAARDYAAHVAFGKRTPDRMAIPSLDVRSFYGITCKSELATLARHFAEERDWDAFDAALVMANAQRDAERLAARRAYDARYQGLLIAA